MITRGKIMQLYDDYLPYALDKVRDYYNELDRGESSELEDMIAKVSLDEAKKGATGRHGETLNIDNIRAAQEEKYAYDEILTWIASKIMDHMSEADIKDLDKIRPDELADDEDVVKILLEEGLRKRSEESQSQEMPEIIYRGAYVADDDEDFYEKEGFRGALEKHADRSDASKSGRVVFVSSEPSVAASYSRKNKFGREGVTPTDYGDYVYAIRTAGLDPSLFKVDRSGTFEEMVFGPQYRYNAPIPQEMVTIRDKAGNERVVPRVEKIAYLSDARLKDVYFPKRLIDAVSRRF